MKKNILNETEYILYTINNFSNLDYFQNYQSEIFIVLIDIKNITINLINGK